MIEGIILINQFSLLRCDKYFEGGSLIMNNIDIHNLQVDRYINRYLTPHKTRNDIFHLKGLKGENIYTYLLGKASSGRKYLQRIAAHGKSEIVYGETYFTLDGKGKVFLPPKKNKPLINCR